ncbi:penicillin-binding protein 2 [Candidatus Saccharibacteria bacterium]|nr:penicillin-binding protein 2 [Candidatus Saccharibacteria bacterium]
MNPNLRLNSQPTIESSANRRLWLWYGILLAVLIVFGARLFYLQIVRHDYYRQQALSNQLKEYTIPATRGVIKAHEGSQIAPLVLNEKLYTLYADPVYISDSHAAASKVAAVTQADAKEYEKAMRSPKTRYVVLAKKLTEQQKKQIEALKIAGIGTQAQDYRLYPQGTLAAQILGFVNSDGQGKYGLEQAMDGTMMGTPGKLKAITDVNGAPLAASRDNIQIDPKAGKDIILTIELGMQKQLETLLKQGLDRSNSKSGSVVIIDPGSGAVKAMANWPTYDPAKYSEVTDASLFNNGAVSSPLEVGSIMKTLTTSAGLDLGVIKPDTTYFDPGHWELDAHQITNVEEISSGTHSVPDIVNLSINTGATWILMQMGGKTGEITATARDRWYDYMVNHFQLGKATGIEQGYEASGYVPDPNNGYALQLTYANTAFGQALTITPLQMAAALSSVVNGGTYYRPYLVDQIVDESGKVTVNKPKIVRSNVVSAEVGRQERLLMEYSLAQHHLRPPFSANYSVGGKTGTAQIANPNGGYYDDRYNGTYLGFVGGDKPQYVVMVRINEPKVGKYAGSSAAQPLFADIAHMLIDNFNVLPKTGP